MGTVVRRVFNRCKVRDAGYNPVSRGIRMQKLIVPFFAILLSPLFALAAGETVLFKGPKTLAAGEKLEVQLVPRKPHPLALRVTLKDADFAGATILTRVGDHAML